MTVSPNPSPDGPTDEEIEGLADEVDSRLTDLGVDRTDSSNLFFALLTCVARQLHRTYRLEPTQCHIWDTDDCGDYIKNVIEHYDGGTG